MWVRDGCWQHREGKGIESSFRFVTITSDLNRCLLIIKLFWIMLEDRVMEEWVFQMTSEWCFSSLKSKIINFQSWRARKMEYIFYEKKRITKGLDSAKVYDSLYENDPCWIMKYSEYVLCSEKCLKWLQ